MLVENFEDLLLDINSNIRCKFSDLKRAIASLKMSEEDLVLQFGGPGAGNAFQQLAGIQSSGLLVDRLCEEIMTLLTVRKRLLLHATSNSASLPDESAVDELEQRLARD
jgi:hypothetical protein